MGAEGVDKVGQIFLAGVAGQPAVGGQADGSRALEVGFTCRTPRQALPKTGLINRQTDCIMQALGWFSR